MPYSINNPQPLQLTLSSVERFHNSYNYYILDGEVPDNAVGCPVVNGNGQVVGIMHKSDSHTTAVDGAYVKQLSVSGLSSLDASLQETGVRTALPDNEEEAITMMTLKKGSVKEDTYRAYVDEFLEKFPTSSFGYQELGLIQMGQDLFDEASKTMEAAIKQSRAKDEAHSDYANLIYQKTYTSQTSHTSHGHWTRPWKRRKPPTESTRNPYTSTRRRKSSSPKANTKRLTTSSWHSPNRPSPTPSFTMRPRKANPPERARH